MINIGLPTDFSDAAGDIRDSIRQSPLDTIQYCFYGSDDVNPIPGGRPFFRTVAMTRADLSRHIKLLKNKGHDFRYLLTGNIVNVSKPTLRSAIKDLLDADVRTFVVRDAALLREIKETSKDTIVIQSLIDGVCTSEAVAKSIETGFDLVCLNIHHPSFISNLPELDPYRNQVEILLNSCCHKACPIALNHYNYYEQTYQLDAKPDQYFIDLNNLFCTLLFLKFPERILDSTFVPQGVIRHLLSKGFTMFKLAGRGMPMSTIADLVSYYFGSTYNPGENVCSEMFRGGKKFLAAFVNCIPADFLSGIPSPKFELKDSDMSQVFFDRMNGSGNELKNFTTTNHKSLVKIPDKKLHSQWISALSNIRRLCHNQPVVNKDRVTQIRTMLEEIGVNQVPG